MDIICLNIISLILHVVIGISLGTAGIGFNTWQMWVIWACILGINVVGMLKGEYL